MEHKPGMTCEEFEELSGAYVLDAVTPEERQAAREHLAGCAKCTHLLEQMRSVVDLLPLSVTQVNPPPSAKERLLAAIRQQQPVIPIERGQQIRRNRGAGAGGWSRRWVGVVAAAVLMFALLGGMTVWNVSLQQTITSLHGQNSALQQEVYELRPQVAVSYALASSTSSAKNARDTCLPGMVDSKQHARKYRPAFGSEWHCECRFSRRYHQLSSSCRQHGAWPERQ